MVWSAFDQPHDLVIAGRSDAMHIVESGQEGRPVSQAAHGQLADHKTMHPHPSLTEKLIKQRIASPNMIYPD